MQELSSKIKEIVESLGFYFIGISNKGNKHNPFIEVFIDTDSGITISECSRASKEIIKFLNSIPQMENFQLNVSSPGIDIPLKENWQYKKNLGRKIEIQFLENEHKMKKTGVLNIVNNNSIILRDENNMDFEIKRDRIIIAKVLI